MRLTYHAQCMGKGSNSPHEITFVGHPVMTTSLRTGLLLDEVFSPDRQRRGRGAAGRLGYGTAARRVRPDADAMLLDPEDAVAPGDTFSYPENP